LWTGFLILIWDLRGMGKVLEGLFIDGGPSKKEVRAILRRKKKGKTLCYVLITCEKPKDDGTIEVELEFDGDRWLAAYILKKANALFDEG
jgi:hypothetical protein